MGAAASIRAWEGADTMRRREFIVGAAAVAATAHTAQAQPATPVIGYLGPEIGRAHV